MFNISILSKGKALLLAILVSCSTAAFAQDYIDEDFMDNIEANAKFMVTETPAAFKENNIPDKWKSESAAILGYSRHVLFDKKNSGGFFTRRERSLYFIEKVRFRIKLMDNSAVEAFSEIYFRYGSKEDGFIAKIAKSDGTVENIDLKNAVGIESGQEKPEFFQSFFDQVAESQYKYYKVPVPNLEPGDILEYVATTKSKLDVTASGYIEFRPFYEVCSKKYPVLYNEIIFETDDKSFFKSLSLNGAPSFQKVNSDDKDFFKYVFIDRNRDTENDVNFVSPYLQYPLVKFQVIYSNSDQVKGALIGEKGELKTSFSKDELARKAWEDYVMVYNESLIPGRLGTVQYFINDCWTELKKLGGRDLPEQQYIDQVYYLMRNKILFFDNYLSDKKFAYIFSALLSQRDIESDLIISTNNNIGKLNQVLFEQEIRYAVRVKDQIYFNITDYSIPGDLVENMLDNEAYIIKGPGKKSGPVDIKPITLPGTRAADNSMEVMVNASLSPSMNSLVLERTSSYKGISKAKNIESALKFTPYIFDDYRNFGGNPPNEKLKAKEQEEYDNSLRAIREEFKKQKPELAKAQLQSEFNQKINNVKFELLSEGRTLKKSVLSVKESFELSDFVRKAGKKYLVNLPGLIGSQLQIKKEERERKYDIDVRYPRVYRWIIKFKIPQGYAVEGLTELNQNIDNTTGGFMMKAREEDGTVIVAISKEYKNKLVPKSSWNDMLAFIDAAYNSSYRYILLKPKQ
jgi:hypothetical protein